MSRSKNYYQGINLGRVQRSEYDDAKLRDVARQDAKLGESLKSVERARNVMKKSMEADRQLFIKTGSQATSKMPSTPQGAYARSGVKAASQQARVKRFSVTDMPSDLDRSISNRGRSLPRRISHHEQITDMASSNAPLRKEVGSTSDKLLEDSTGYLGSIKNHFTHPTNTSTTLVSLDRLRESDQSATSEIDRGVPHSINRSTTNTPKLGKSLSKADPDQANESSSGQSESNGGCSNEVDGQPSDQPADNDGDIKIKRSEQAPVKDQEFKPGKRPTIWETLSTPKQKSITKSKRSQIELEFTTSRLKNSKSSPALFSAAKIKTSASQGKPPLTGSGNLQGRQVDVSNVKQLSLSSSRSRNDL